MNFIRYLNTDLDLTSSEDLAELLAALDAVGLKAFLPPTKGEDGLWHVTLQSALEHNHPETNIAALLIAIESLDGRLRAVWEKCSLREFNIGYYCGTKPWAYSQGLSTGLLRRMEKLGISLRITLYPPESTSA